jgi:hypothetical protein
MTMQIIQRYENGIRVESGFRDDYEPGDHVYLTGPGNLLRGPYDDRLWRNGEEVRKTTRIETLLLCAGAFTAAATIAAAVALAAVWWLSTPAKADTVVLSGEGTVQVQQDGAVIGVYPIAN